jgi:hypothetical protein
MISEAELRATDDVAPWISHPYPPTSCWIVDHRTDQCLARISEEGESYIKWRRINNLPIFRGQKQYFYNIREATMTRDRFVGRVYRLFVD